MTLITNYDNLVRIRPRVNSLHKRLLLHDQRTERELVQTTDSGGYLDVPIKFKE